MAGSSKANKCYNIRSITLPCRSHPSTLRIEEELNKLKAWEASPMPTAENVCNGLSGLEELYKCMDDLYNLPMTQQALSQHQHEKWINELLDGSLRLLDVCGTTRDAVSQMKEHVRDLQSSLQRRKGDSRTESRIVKYNCFRKKMEKDARKLIAALKRFDNKIEASLLLDVDHDTSSVIRVLREVSVLSSCVFQSLLLFLSVPILKAKPTKWSLVSKMLRNGKVACEEQQDIVINELKSVDVALQTLRGSKSSEGDDNIQIAQSSLEALGARIEGVENGLEGMFRRLIKTRASLLNIVSQ
ncbi:uncharacterized protein LOC132316299 [Cornus florida]|uniref:uncharacterized protein LOC132316299 n=1 Tax=Cornus florida TaxID=4283 RepID=UPI0028985217|nr:uncharacterized protein LOC132316299 [Cornus florida]